MDARACHVVFYDDAAHFGGHELMTLSLVEHLAQSDKYRVSFIASAHNAELCQRLGALAPRVKRLLTDYTSGRGQWLRSYASLLPLWRLWRLLRQSQPALLIVVQGGIALSSLGLLAAKLAGVRCLSYLPMTHDEGLFAKTPLRAWLRQRCVQPFYSLPDCLVTISARMAAYAARRRRGTVRVVENGIQLPQIKPESRDAIRRELGLKANDQLLLMMGRIEFWQKRHDLGVQALALARQRGVPLHLLVVGSGPDEAVLRAQVQALGLGSVVHWRAWQSDVAPFYAACDQLLLPSRYEGVPLVMLEAMHVGRKIVAADVDGMADMLPAAWLFPAGDATALADLLCAPRRAADEEHLRAHRQRIATQHTVRAFAQRFARLIDEQAGLPDAAVAAESSTASKAAS